MDAAVLLNGNFSLFEPVNQLWPKKHDLTDAFGFRTVLVL